MRALSPTACDPTQQIVSLLARGPEFSRVGHELVLAFRTRCC